jgi:y4mF family transcriptional regulator
MKTMVINNPAALGLAVLAARKQLGLTQSQLALASGVGLRFIVDLEGGKPTVRFDCLLRVAQSLGGLFVIEGLPHNSEAS